MAGLSYVISRDLLAVISSMENWDYDGGALAIKAVKTQLLQHESLQTTRGQKHSRISTKVPTLFDAAAEQVARLLGENPEGEIKSLEGLSPNVLGGLVYKLENIPYSVFRSSMQPSGEKDVDEWVLRNEVWLREISSTAEHWLTNSLDGEEGESLKVDWTHGLVRLSAHADAVFPGSILKETCRIVTRPTSLPGLKILDGRRPSTIHIQPSVKKFAQKFEAMTGGLLKGLEWDHVFVAGGIVLGALLCTDDKDATSTPEQWKSSDVDLYIHGLGPIEANKKMEHIFSVFKANLPENSPVLVVRNSKTVTFFSSYPLRRIQVVLKLVRSPKDVLLNFDLDICAVGWDGEEVWMLPRAARALETGYTVFTMDLINGHYLGDRRETQEQRVFKYADKGYGIRILPSYLQERQAIMSDLEKQQELGISDTGHWDTRDIEELVDAARSWTAIAVDYPKNRPSEHPLSHPRALAQIPRRRVPVMSHGLLQERDQITEDPPRRSALSGLSLFMRHVALWEHEVAGDIIIDKTDWAVATYGNHCPTDIDYNDIPNYSWDKQFTMQGFITGLNRFNEKELSALHKNFETLSEDDELDGVLEKLLAEGLRVQRTSHAASVQEVLESAGDIYLPVWLPESFIDFADDLIPERVRDSGVLNYNIRPFERVIDVVTSENQQLTLVLWRITSVTMWQQMDRTIDEVHEVLWSFFYANAGLHLSRTDRTALFLSQLSRRAIRVTEQDEYGAFARWVARIPEEFEDPFSSGVYMDFIDGLIDD